MTKDSVASPPALGHPVRTGSRTHLNRAVWAAGIMGLAAIYFCSAKLGLKMAFVAEQVTAVWPPTGISLAALFLFGTRFWPGVALGAFLANVTAHEPPGTALGIAAGNTLEALVGAWLLRRLAGFAPSFERLKDVLAFVLLAALGSTTVSATIGVTSLCLGGIKPWQAFGPLWWVWWLGDATSALLVAPLILIWSSAPARRWPGPRVAEAGALVTALGVTALVVFGGGLDTAVSHHPLEYTVFPFVIWAALRFGQPGTTVVTFLASGVAIAGTVSGLGPFAGTTVHESLILLQAFMGVVAVTALFLSAAITERATAERRRAADFAITQVLARATLEEAIPRILEVIGETFDWDLGNFWTVDREAKVLRWVAVRRRPTVQAAEFEALSRRSVFELGVGLPGRVWATREPAWIPDVIADENFPRLATAAAEGFHGALAFPVRLGEEVLGVIEFFSTKIRRPDYDLLRMLTSVGSQLGHFIERRRAEEERQQLLQREQEGEAEFRAMFELAGVGKGQADPVTGRFLRVNRKQCEITGYSAEELLGMTSVQLTHPDDRARDQALFGQLLRGEIAEESIEKRYVRKDGTTVWVHVTATILRDAAGRPLRSVAVVQDITDRKRVEEALRQSEERFQVALQGSPIIVFCQDRELRHTWIHNPHPAFTTASILGKTDEELHEPATAQRLTAIKRAVLESGVGVRREVDVVIDGQRMCYDVRLEPLHDAAGRVVGLTGAAADVTQQKQLQEQLQRRAAQLAETDRRKDEFLAMLAHELRNPLAPIRNALEILKMRGADEAIVASARAMMERQFQHLVRLVDDLLDVSRIHRGKIQLRKERVDLGTMITRAVETARPVIDAQGHELTVSLPPRRLFLQGDLTRLAQVVANLLNNAAKYTEGAGRIWLSAEQEGDAVVLRVRDTGIGIRQELLPQIFDLFVQSDRALDRAQGGLGIGLTLVHRLVEMHGGTVAAHSAGQGQGSEFVVRLPLLPTEAQEEPAQTDGPVTAASLPRRILVVDDNVDAAESLALLLRMSRHVVQVAHNGPAALDAAARYPPDLVFLDIGLPGMNGYEVAQRLRQVPALERVVLVAVTGYGQEEDRRRSQEAGFDHHLVKPVELGLMEPILAAVIDRGTAEHVGGG
jgi:PAS domain S-box-containing protein